MRTTIKLTLHQPIRSALFVFAIALIAFAFFLRALEGIIVYSETGRLSKNYRAIGSIQPVDPDAWDVKEGVSLIEESDYIQFIDQYTATSAVMDGIYSPNNDGTLSIAGYHNRLLLYGTLTGKSSIDRTPVKPGGGRSRLDILGGPMSLDDFEELLYDRGLLKYMTLFIRNPELFGMYMFEFDVDELELGLPDYVKPGDKITLILPYMQGDNDLRMVYNESEEGGYYYLKATYERINDIIASIIPLYENGPYFYPSDTSKRAEIAELRLEKEQISKDIRTIALIGTKDMSARPDVMHNFYLSEGRYIDYNDYLNETRVCAINRGFAELRGLSIGDEIPLSMRRVIDPLYGYPYPGDDSWRGTEMEMETFVIVGIYSKTNTSMTGLTWENNDVYIPVSCTPAEWGQPEYDYNISFTLKRPDDETAFSLEYSDALARLGFTLIFEPNGWGEYAPAASAIRSSSLTGALTFTAVYTITLYLVVYLYFLTHRKEYAIMRALGVQKRNTARRVSAPILLFGTLGILSGCAFASSYAEKKAMGSLKLLSVTQIKGLPLYWPVALAAFAAILYFMFTIANTRRLGKRSVLELLQGGAARIKAHAKPTRPENAESAFGLSIDIAEANSLNRSISNVSARIRTAFAKHENGVNHSFLTAKLPRCRGACQIYRHIARHILASARKSALITASALVFTTALGIISENISSYEQELSGIYKSTVVTGIIVKTIASEYINGNRLISSRTVNEILGTGYILDYYVEAADIVTIIACDADGESIGAGNGTGTVLKGINQPELYEPIKSGMYEFEFIDGYDIDMFRSGGASQYAVALSRGFMEQIDAELGGYVRLIAQGISKVYRVAGCYGFLEEYSGYVRGGDSFENLLVPLAAFSDHLGQMVCFDRAEFTVNPEMNRELGAFRDALDEIFTKPMTPRLTFVLRDDMLRDVAEPLATRIELIKLLFPIIIAASVLFATGITALVVMQGSTDIAIMRVLGTTKRRIRATVIFEQALLCAIGLLIGLLVASLLGKIVFGSALLYLAGCIAAAAIASLVATSKKPLEMLQVKE